MRTNYAASTGAQKRMLVQRWKAFSLLSVEVENLDNTESGLKVKTYLDRVAVHRELDAAREAYVQALVAVGLIGLDDETPTDDWLWEIHPVNIEQELA